MKKTIGLAALLLAAGCAQQYPTLREAGNRMDHRMQRPPATAAACVTRNIRGDGKLSAAGLHADVRDGNSLTSTEITVAKGTSLYLSAEFMPAADESNRGGSDAMAWLSTSLAGSVEARLRQAFDGC